MPDYVLSNLADGDLDEIYERTFRDFGEAQADVYFLTLMACLDALVSSPHLGRTADDLHPGLRRHVCAQHAIFYIPTETGIFIVRVLHQSMDAPRHL